MLTKQAILKRIKEIITLEKNKLFTAPSRFLPTNTDLIKRKIKGLKALKKAISDSSENQKDIPAQTWLKKTIKMVVENHPALNEGFLSDTRQLLQNIAPGWETFTSPSRPSALFRSTGIKSQLNTLHKSSSPDDHYFFEVQLVGDSGVGKSSTLLRFCDNTFIDDYVNTIGIDLKSQQVDGVTLRIWDAAGPLRREASSRYVKNMDAIIIMLDITNWETFDNAVSRIVPFEKDYNNEKTQFFLVGNKSDLNSERKVRSEDARDYAEKLNLPYIEISARDDKNVDELFKLVVKSLKEQKKNENAKHSNTLEKYSQDLQEEIKADEDSEEGKKPDGGGGCTIS